MVQSPIPRLSPTIIRRPRVEEWFVRCQATPVRLVVAPPGSGKTTAVVSSMQHGERAGVYCNLEPGMRAEEVLAALAAALGMRGDAQRALEGIIAELARRAPIDVCIDQASEASPAGVAVVERLMHEAPDGVALILVMRSRVAIDVSELVNRGVGVLCDYQRLAFSAGELGELADACGVDYTHTDLHRLWEATEGWALAASGAIRRAAEDGQGLADAFERWRSNQGHLFGDFVRAWLRDADAADQELVQALMAGEPCDDQRRLAELERSGLFVVFRDDEYRPLHALSALRSSGAAQRGRTSVEVTPLQVRLFGRFVATVGEKPIPWVRRRDQQIFKYLALKRQRSAPRAELLKIFWPEAERHLADQSLRTACSNIRKAIAGIVGYDRVDAYFRVSGEVELDAQNVVIDVQRFVAHAENGDEKFERNDLRGARAHYLVADQLHARRLLAGDAVERWCEAKAEMLADRHRIVLERLAEIARELDDPREAGRFAERARALRPEHARGAGALATALR